MLRAGGTKGFWHKIADDGTRKPFDIVACVQPSGKLTAIESKVSRSVSTVNMKSLFSNGREHQLRTLSHIRDIGGLSWVLVAQKDGLEWGCLAFTPGVAKELFDEGTGVDVDELRRSGLCIFLDRIEGGYWDLTPLFR